ncbi:glycoside hydrolase family 2 protein [Paenibacillus alkalitolerans]|uniref:glycoside hydrolase family 2 protein n=1 Tax=Paenibacillus alkalitolerans TaxID=2799335 RepID=UPI0018F4B70F|nr:glycoside hydrolase family 2 TIM barrel-domain containing protein [Paenibacillus alkalitolerans]
MRHKEVRAKINVNREWRFIRGDWQGFSHIGPEQADYDDSNWSHVGLPHSFSIPYFMENEWYVGYGWYRKHLDVPACWMDKMVHLEFDGVFQVAELYVNGNLAGTHEGGYTGFCITISEFLRPGDNVIAVRVNNEWNGQIAPRSGEHTFSGGIYRDVSLTMTEPLHIAWNGTFVSTPLLASSDDHVRMQVRMQTEVINRSGTDKIATVRTIVTDSQGQVLTEMESTQTVPAGGVRRFDSLSEPIDDPRLWCPEDPYLYLISSEVVADGAVSDVYEDTMGFRWMEWTAHEGFYLNGKHVYLNGANVHQDQAGWGDAVTQAAIYRDVKMIKDAGMNFIRGSHYPHHPAFARACDHYGILFWSEATFWGMGGGAGDTGERKDWRASAYPVLEEDQSGFERSAIRQLREMIRINRNRPSIIVWSMCNEPFFSHESVKEKAIGLIKKMVEVAHEEDPTRKAAAGGAQRWNLDRPDISDVAGLNGDGGSFYLKWDGDERVEDPESDRPGCPQLISEYGSEVMDRPGKYRPYYDHVSASRTDPYRFAAPAWRSGQAVWCGFHHGSLANDMGHMGIIDYYRLPLRSWYWYRFNYYAKQTGASVDDLGYLGIRPPAAGSSEPEWPKPGTPVRIKLYPGVGSKTTIKNDGTDDIQIVVELVDEYGNRVDATADVALSVISGPGQFPSYDPKRITSETGLDIIEGLGAITFRSYHAGETIISANSPGLQGAALLIKTVGDGTDKEPDMTIPRIQTSIPRDAEFSAELLDLSTHRPTRASSEAKGYGKSNANNADRSTSWRASSTISGEWWMLDLEGIKYPKRIELEFDCKGPYQFVIEGSSDGNRWSTLLDYHLNREEIDSVNELLPPNASRYVKIVFTVLPAGEAANLKSFGLFGVNNE